jgi:hypothetical protein
MKYRFRAFVVLEDPDGTKATDWKAAIKTKAIQLKNSGTLASWIAGTASINIVPYFIGGDDTIETSISCPPEE